MSKFFKGAVSSSDSSDSDESEEKEHIVPQKNL